MAYQNYWGTWLSQSGPVAAEFWGGSGNDTLYGTGGNDSIIPNGGWDSMYGGAGDDTYWGAGNILEQAGQGTDLIRSWSSVTLPANVENALVFGNGSYAAGNSGDNIIEGQEGDQFIYGGTGADVLIGGYGADTFVVVRGEGPKVIQDFSPGWAPWGDKVRLQGSALYTFDQIKAAMTQQGADVVLNNGGEAILFRNTAIGQFAPDDFAMPINYATLGAPTFSEEFNALQLNNPQTGANGWVPHLGFGGETNLGSFTLQSNGEQQLYVSPRFQGTTGAPLGLNPFSVQDGVLTIKAQAVDQNTANQMFGYHYTSGAITTQNLFSQKYGYFEMRADLPEGNGLWPAFWMIRPGSSVELDILEALGSEPNVVLNATHSVSGGDNLVKTFNPHAEGFHNYGVLWTAETLTFYLDGVEVLKTNTPYEMNDPMYMIVNLAVGGRWAGSPEGTAWPAEMKIDYVRAYNLPGAATTTPPVVTPPVVTPPVTPPAVGGLVQGDGGAALNGTAAGEVLTLGRGGGAVAGGAGGDTFAFTALPWSAPRITDFAVGTDKLDLSALFSASGYAGTDPVGDRYLSFASDGAGGTKVYYDADGAGSGSPWPTLLATLQGVSPQTAASVLLGQPGAPSSGGTTPPPATGGALSQGDNGLSLSGTGGNDTLVLGRGGGGVTGGGGADSFQLKALPWSAPHITDFAVGTDKLDLSALFAASGYSGSDPVGDHYVSLSSNGAGGANVYYDPDGWGSGSPWPTLLAILDNVSPTTSAATLLNGGGSAGSGGTGGAAGQRLFGGDSGAAVTGGSGADTLVAGRGAGMLTGGGGADTFEFGTVPWSAGRITDFQTGADKLDLRQLLSTAGYRGSNPIGDHYIILSAEGSATNVWFDSDGWGSGTPWPSLITTLNNVAPSSVTAADWLL